MRVALFVEDAAQLAFIRALVERIAAEEGVSPQMETRNAVGGKGTAMRTFRQYVRDMAVGRESFAEVLVVAIDGNCRGPQTVAREIQNVASQAGFAGTVVPAVPDPHVELWYLADGRAVLAVAQGHGTQPGLPERKCEPERYKQLLREVFLSVGIDPPAGGAEYGEDIAKALDLARAETTQHTLAVFAFGLRGAIRQARLAEGGA